MKTKIVLFGIVLALLILLAPGSALGWSPYGYAPPWPGPDAATVTPPGSMRLERRADQDNYYLTLHLSGMTPGEVNIAMDPGGRWLNIASDDSNQTSHEESNDQGGYYYSRSFSYSSSRLSRRISLPRDADAGAMQRVDKEGRVEVTIPRQH